VTESDAPGLAFRAADSGDVATIVALVQSAYRGDASRAGWTTEADLLDGQRTDELEIRDVIAAPRALMLLAESAGECVGCCKVELLRGDAASFGLFAVRPTLQGRGVGRALVAEAERVAVRDGARAMRMTVIRQRAELLHFYARLGYRPTGEVAPFPYGDARAGIPRRPDLEFVLLEKPLRDLSSH
jgi:ribosomal protein S18 acetylase RimI-like enzyme